MLNNNNVIIIIITLTTENKHQSWYQTLYYNI